MKKILAAAVAVAAFATPALAAEFYVAQDAATKKCVVAEAKPDGTTQMQRGEKAFATKEEADAAIVADAECVK
jgi:opacity protein-like surface antigen